MDGDSVSGAVLFPQVSAAVPEGMVWQYRIILRGGRETHTWGLTGERGGIHVDAWEASIPGWREECWQGGIEGHSPSRREYDGEKPDHEHCWLIGGPCWHDGSSLQFSEQIAPYLPEPGRPFTENDHLDVLRIMVSRYRDWLPDAALRLTQGDA
jgi:hypothetical protein